MRMRGGSAPDGEMRMMNAEENKQEKNMMMIRRMRRRRI